VDRSILFRCVQFFRAFPIVATWRQLSWAHFRVLIPIADPKQRRALATEANRNEWPVARLEQRIRALAVANEADDAAVAITGGNAKPLTPKRGTPGICQVIAAGDSVAVDLGFATYLDLPEGADFAARALVKLDADGRITAAANGGKADLFTYSAAVLKVVDGDTLWVKVYLRPRYWVKQKLRLRDLDCPEMDTAEGRAAKRFVEGLVGRTTGVTICTTKPDKYDRYLADVFLTLDDGNTVYLNNALLENGHAIRKKSYEVSDWGS
jgi:endonuclease YncB( thermonuclease family)